MVDADFDPLYCENCLNQKWVCENHPNLAWCEFGCECGAGMPCPKCNDKLVPDDLPHFKVIVKKGRR